MMCHSRRASSRHCNRENAKFMVVMWVIESEKLKAIRKLFLQENLNSFWGHDQTGDLAVFSSLEFEN